jgi:hypothetical protein
MRSSTGRNRRPCAVVPLFAWVFVCLSLSTTGCIALIDNLIRVVKGQDLPAEFDKLEGKRVAVVVKTSAGINADAPGVVMAGLVYKSLASKVKKIDLVEPEEVNQVVRDQPAGSQNMERMGRKLKVDYLIAVDLENLKLKEGATLYRGRSDCSMAVYQVGEGEQPVFTKQFLAFTYPSDGIAVTEMDESKFLGMYLTMLSGRVARTFYPYDPSTDVAIDAAAYGLNRF